MGRVLNLAGQPVRDAYCRGLAGQCAQTVHPPERPHPAPLNPNFDGAAILKTVAEGRYPFKTIKHTAYPAGPDMMRRPAHIHFQVTGREDRLVTQMYFVGNPYNTTDPFLNSADARIF